MGRAWPTHAVPQFSLHLLLAPLSLSTHRRVPQGPRPTPPYRTGPTQCPWGPRGSLSCSLGRPSESGLPQAEPGVEALCPASGRPGSGYPAPGSSLAAGPCPLPGFQGQEHLNTTVAVQVPGAAGTPTPRPAGRGGHSGPGRCTLREAAGLAQAPGALPPTCQTQMAPPGFRLLAFNPGCLWAFGARTSRRERSRSW